MMEGRLPPTAHRGVPISSDSPAPPALPAEDVDFGQLRRLTPISTAFGFDRGRPVDRYYIDNFLARHAADIRGRVLEIGDRTYTRRFSDDCVTQSDVLDVKENPQATFHGSLPDVPQLPSESFDCVLLPQTLHQIYETGATLRTLHRVLRPGGVLLATFPGITRLDQGSGPGDRWYWSFTSLSARRLFTEVFAAGRVQVEAFGNVLVAVAALHGLAAEELRPEELDYQDPNYELVITVRAVR